MIQGEGSAYLVVLKFFGILTCKRRQNFFQVMLLN